MHKESYTFEEGKQGRSVHPGDVRKRDVSDIVDTWLDKSIVMELNNVKRKRFSLGSVPSAKPEEIPLEEVKQASNEPYEGKGERGIENHSKVELLLARQLRLVNLLITGGQTINVLDRNS